LPVSLFGVPPLPTAKGERCGGLMEIAQENPAEVFPAHTLFLAKAVGACVETGRSLHYPPCNRNGYRGFCMFFPLFPPSLLFAPWSLCGKHPKAGAGSTARRQKRRIIGLCTRSPPMSGAHSPRKACAFVPACHYHLLGAGEHRLLFRTGSYGLESTRGHGQLRPPSCQELVLPGRTGAAPPGVEGLSGPRPYYPVFVRYGFQALCGSAEVRRLLP
jgi:hypothetical protein